MPLYEMINGTDDAYEQYPENSGYCLYNSIRPIRLTPLIFVFIEKAIDESVLLEQLKQIYSKGIHSLAIAFLHSYKIAAKVGFTNISLSSDVMPMIKIVPRGYTACADAYLTPIIRQYISNFNAGFADNLDGVRVEFFGSRAIMSGPAAVTYEESEKRETINSMLTSSRYAGSFAHVMETTVAGVTIQAPQVLDIRTVAAGGGESSFNAMQHITNEANAFYRVHSDSSRAQMSVEETALGFIDVANETMCRAVKSITQHMLACFGGAGGQHACAIAKSLGIKTIFVHRFSGILSAYGLALADVVHEAQEPAGKTFTKENFEYFLNRLDSLKKQCRCELTKVGFTDNSIRYEPFLHMRYERTDCALMCASPDEETIMLERYEEVFHDSYKREFGFTIPDRAIIVDDIRVRGVGISRMAERVKIAKTSEPDNPPLKAITDCYFRDGKLKTKVYSLNDLKYGHTICGPSIIIDKNSTIVIEPLCKATITDEGNILISVGDQARIPIGDDIDAIQLSIFSHRFMSIAEQMGQVLQRSAISTNIKATRICLSNCFAGGMQATVRFQIEHLTYEGLRDGDVILCNHPKAGGSHLPDFTVITPRPAFFVANRGHHADIGGLVPGSMPPHSTSLSQEGAAFISFKLVEEGRFQEAKVVELLNAPANVPGCSGTRNLSDNLSDLRAQIAANQKVFLNAFVSTRGGCLIT
uniref:5-oxoprolinase n=1 Tax=Parascaris equorum TaxID=6256 RepID=A0A914RF51_PAREQ